MQLATHRSTHVNADVTKDVDTTTTTTTTIGDRQSGTLRPGFSEANYVDQNAECKIASGGTALVTAARIKATENNSASGGTAFVTATRINATEKIDANIKRDALQKKLAKSKPASRTSRLQVNDHPTNYTLESAEGRARSRSRSC